MTKTNTKMNTKAIEQSEHEDGIAAPAHNLLKQAQELLATAASSDSADDTSGEHRAMLDRDGSDDTCDSNDHSMLTPLAPAFGAHEDDSSDDAVIAADSVVAAALALPSSDESSKDASEE
ncbi:hypothetical protein ON010_g15168 [Phytophthora cinnamomi]|nr:hypothetical protein ON010_g15168 [Phytophthora cinnamomi]